ncbi:hypothetical protein [Leptolyngbya sp. FACHB-711]|uniref:hypothetical protein n=1 Tax=unclassified Leptolyngbya TaxID=2650499 RepID=UPI0016820E68|nr:hypothetical protein [Leptolyngbya sp. FACHB-711]MBD1849178.1 hypothetical protein [Cyanobacteria bacterium FACHB-502]MBD2024936.1 hypothetical protein [Leptolyngbya sp. FACHB-711]
MSPSDSSQQTGFNSFSHGSGFSRFDRKAIGMKQRSSVSYNSRRKPLPVIKPLLVTDDPIFRSAKERLAYLQSGKQQRDNKPVDADKAA